jgi:serine phosphatase RsbU (regulator of sigma subunit)
VFLLLMTLFVFQFGATLMGLYLAHQLGKSVDDLFAGVGRLSGGDFAARIRPRTRDQVGQLALAFNQMAARIQESIQERQVRLKLEEELRVAREVQMHLLPDIPALAHGAAVHATLQPAKEVAGDYYDLYRLADGRLAFLIADVSGKGTSAAFYAAETKGVLAALDKTKRGPREVAARLNEIWCEGHGRRVFMTMVYGLFDPGTGGFELVRCGHPAPLVRRADGRVEALSVRGLGIGLSATDFAALTDVASGRLEPGDALLCYTDGLSEAADSEDRLFGEARIAEVLAASADGIPERLLAAVNTHTGGVAPEDDLTLVVLRR